MKQIIETPLKKEKINNLKAGDFVYITGEIYTARDAAHKRMDELINDNKQLPFDIEDSIIYYLGPSPARQGKIIGSAGPTTSGRMDKYTPKLLELGLAAMIGKGNRNKEVVESIQKYRSIYFLAVGGAGALLSRHIIKSEIIAFEDLGTEAIRKLTVIEFPVIVGIDEKGTNLYNMTK